ncbi:MAG: Fic family protein [Candidatus Dojkabacteria bacterium]
MTFDPNKPHLLAKLPTNATFDKSKFFEKIGNTRALLGELKGACRSIPEPLLLTYPTLIKEAVDSSKIENIETQIIDVLQNEVFPESQRGSNESQVIKYRDAAMWGFKNLSELGLSTRLITGIQKILLSGDGSYRNLQNQIMNKSTSSIVYTPPISSSIPDYMSNWENYVNDKSTNDLDPLIKCAICHYQFEAIHPFGDGNGRTGRILMLLQLVEDNVIGIPILYVSNYINKHRPEYYTVLNEVTSLGNWEAYISFMLDAFYSQSKATLELVTKVNDTYDKFLEKLRSSESTKLIHNLDMIVDKLFTFPVISPKLLSTTMNVGADTASRNLKLLAETGLIEAGKSGIYNLYFNRDLIQIMNNDSI